MISCIKSSRCGARPPPSIKLNSGYRAHATHAMRKRPTKLKISPTQNHLHQTPTRQLSHKSQTQPNKRTWVLTRAQKNCAQFIGYLCKRPVFTHSSQSAYLFSSLRQKNNDIRISSLAWGQNRFFTPRPVFTTGSSYSHSKFKLSQFRYGHNRTMKELDLNWVVPLLAGVGLMLKNNKEDQDAKVSEEFYSFSAQKMDGTILDFNSLRGKAVIIINIPLMHEGFEDKFLDIVQKIHQKYHAYGIEILCFPCGEFSAIHKLPILPTAFSDAMSKVKKPVSMPDLWKRKGYSFTLMAPIKINEGDGNPIFAFLTDHLHGWVINNVYWNYTKFFVSAEGIPAFRLPPAHEPEKLVRAVIDILPFQPKDSSKIRPSATDEKRHAVLWEKQQSSADQKK